MYQGFILTTSVQDFLPSILGSRFEKDLICVQDPRVNVYKVKTLTLICLLSLMLE